jgi:hypothetical protein
VHGESALLRHVYALKEAEREGRSRHFLVIILINPPNEKIVALEQPPAFRDGGRLLVKKPNEFISFHESIFAVVKLHPIIAVGPEKFSFCFEHTSGEPKAKRIGDDDELQGAL